MPKHPVYQQLQDEIRSLIDNGEFEIGDKFLSERQVAERFQVSRPTANKVLASLVADGRLEFRKGVGTFVCDNDNVLGYDLRILVSFTDKVRAMGKTPFHAHFAFRGNHGCSRRSSHRPQY